VSPIHQRELHTREILGRLEKGDAISQRSLSRDLGIALGLTNLLLRQMARNGLVRLRRIKPNRVRYLITPAGIAEKARLSHKYLRDSMTFYAEARRRIQTSFAMLADGRTGATDHIRVVFWGAGELAEIGYVCLQDSGLRLVGVVDDARVGQRFFGHPVRTSSSLVGDSLDGEVFDTIIVISLDDEAAVVGQLSRVRIDAKRLFWISGK
jgi:hypothetical protein